MEKLRVEGEQVNWSKLDTVEGVLQANELLAISQSSVSEMQMYCDK